MAVTHVPSFWDYLGQALSGLPSVLAQKQQMELLEESEKRAKAQEQRTQQMFGHQIAPFEMRQNIMEAEANPSLLPSFMGGVALPIPKKIFSEQQYEFAGLKSLPQRQRATKRESMDLLEQENRLPVSEIEGARARAQLPNVGADVAMENTAKVMELVGPFAESFVAQELTKTGGIPQRANLAQLANKAWQAFTADPTIAQQVGARAVNVQNLKPQFDKAVMDAFNLARDKGIQELEAQARMRSLNDTTPQLMNSITRVAQLFEARVKTAMQEDMNVKIAMVKAMDPKMKAQMTPEEVAALQKLQTWQSHANTLTAASAGLAAGTVTPGEAQRLLAQAMASIETDTPVGGVAAPPPAPGTAGTLSSDQMNKAVTNLRNRYAPSQWRDRLQQDVDAGLMSPETMAQILRLLERGK